MHWETAQADLRRAHVNGAAGVVVSGLVWLATGLVWHLAGPRNAFVFLFFGGMAIAPLAGLVARFAFKPPAVGAGKRLEWIGLATVPIILAGFFVAWRWFGMASDRAIPLVAMAVGLRYLAFTPMFGMVQYLALGGAFILIGGAAFVTGAGWTGNAALALGLVELVFAGSFYKGWRQPTGVDSGSA